MLKKVDRGIKLPEDMEMLRTRVFPKNDPCIPKNTLYVFPKLETVNEYNRKIFGELDGDFDVIEAKNIMPTKKQFNPAVDKDGKVNKTPLDNHLYLKKKARVVLVHNIDVSDGLNNGAKGEVLDKVKDDEGNVTQVIIKFDNMESGARLKENQTSAFQSKFPQGTPISKLHFYYSFSRKQAVEGQKALCVQFPL